MRIAPGPSPCPSGPGGLASGIFNSGGRLSGAVQFGTRARHPATRREKQAPFTLRAFLDSLPEEVRSPFDLLH
jgi:hypothetical protein